MLKPFAVSIVLYHTFIAEMNIILNIHVHLYLLSNVTCTLLMVFFSGYAKARPGEAHDWLITQVIDIIACPTLLILIIIYKLNVTHAFSPTVSGVGS